MTFQKGLICYFVFFQLLLLAIKSNLWPRCDQMKTNIMLFVNIPSEKAHFCFKYSILFFFFLCPLLVPVQSILKKMSNPIKLGFVFVL